MKNNVPHLLLDTLGDKQFWNAIFRAGVDALVLPLVMLGAVGREFVREVTVARGGKK